MLQLGASLTYNTSSVNYDRNMFIIQATGFVVVKNIFSEEEIEKLARAADNKQSWTNEQDLKKICASLLGCFITMPFS
jgi:hypothetical protein